MTDTNTQDILAAFVAGDREAVKTAVCDALDNLVHDFIFNGADAAPADAPADLDPSLGGDDLGADPTLGDDLSLDAELDGAADLDADPSLDGTLPPVEDELAVESVDLELDDESNDDDLNLDIDTTDTDVAADVLDADLGAASDVTDITSDDEGLDGAAPTVTGVAIDAEQGDSVVSAVTMNYSDGSDFTFFTFAEDADKVVSAIQSLTGGEEGDATLSSDAIADQLSENFNIKLL